MLNIDENQQPSDLPVAASAATDFERSAAKPAEMEPITGMNNFFMNLPEGYYRNVAEMIGNSGQYEDLQTIHDRLRLFSEIDVLLALEFSALDWRRAVELIQEAKEMQENLRKDNSIDSETRASLKRIVDKKFSMAEKLLTPLFNRLLELGFDGYFLGA